MTDDRTRAATARQGSFIRLEHDYEVRGWARAFGCSEAELREAVNAVGHDSDNVRRFLRQRK